MKQIIRLLGISASLATLSPLYAQNLVDATRFSDLDINGTARFKSMAGAFGALGGDPSAIHNNPAGVGIYRGTSEITLTADFSSVKCETDGTSSAELKKRNFAIPNLSYIISFATPDCESLVNFNLGMSFNHSGGVKRKYAVFRNDLPSSFSDYLANITNNALLYANQYDNPDYLTSDAAWDHMPLMGLMAYDTYAIDKSSNDDQYGTYAYNQIHRGLDFKNSMKVREENRTDEYSLNASANWSDFIYAGITVSVTDYNSTINTDMHEDYTDNNYIDYYNDLETKGSGVNIKLGLLAKLNDYWRLGMAVHTPTWYSMRDLYGADIYHIANNEEKHCASNNNLFEYKYRFSTPWQYQMSTAFILGTKGLISLEYDLTDYCTMRYKASNSDGYEMDKFDAQTSFIKDYMQEMHTIKIGAEYRATKTLSIRAGYATQTSPYKDEVFDTNLDLKGDEDILYGSSTKPNYALLDKCNYLSFGLGWRFDGWYLDFAAVYKQQTEKIGMFPSSDAFCGYDNFGESLGYVDYQHDAEGYGAVRGAHTSLTERTLNYNLTLGFKF